MADGLGSGDNTRAAVITRGLAELTRLGVAMGGDPLTFAGLAGMGDLVATCISPQSRNRYVGEQLGRGRTIDEIIAEMNMVAEGVKTLDGGASSWPSGTASRCRSPSEVVAVCHDGRPAAEAYRGLLRRAAGSERHGMGSGERSTRERSAPGVLRRLMGRLRITDDIVRHLSTFQRLGETVEVELPGRAAAGRRPHGVPGPAHRGLPPRSAPTGCGRTGWSASSTRRRRRSCRAATCRSSPT